MARDSMKNPPLQRHVSLQPLSRDHYVGLVQAQRLIKAAGASAEQRRQALDDFARIWTEEIEPHFGDEERLLWSLMNPDDTRRLHEEHARIRALAADAAAQRQVAEPDAGLIQGLGQLLNDHIRWEERQLFVEIERSAGEQSLQQLQRETEQIEQSRPRNIQRG